MSSSIATSISSKMILSFTRERFLRITPSISIVTVLLDSAYSLAVIGPDNKVRLRKIEVGPSSHGLQIVTNGVAEGDRVVVEGVQKVSEGALVDPRPAPETTPAASSSPSGTATRN